MTADVPAPDDLDEAVGLVAAMLGAYFAGDEAGVEVLVADADHRPVVAALLGLLGFALTEIYGADDVRRAVALWVPGEGLPHPDDLSTGGDGPS